MLQPIIFTKAGNINLRKYDKSGKLGDSANSYFRHGDLFSVQPNNNVSRSTIESGNSIYPVAERITAIDSTLALVFNTLDPEMESFIYNRNLYKETDSIIKNINHEIVIPDATPFEVKLPHKVNNPTSALAADINNDPYENVATVTKSKEFSITDDKITFSADDAGKTVYLTYEYKADAVVEEVKGSEESAIMQLEHSTEATTEKNGQIYDIYMVYDRVQVTEYGVPLIGKTPSTRSMTIKVLKPRGNNPAVTKKYVLREGSGE